MRAASFSASTWSAQAKVTAVGSPLATSWAKVGPERTAIGAVGSGSTIQIAAGSYAENLDTEGKAIRLVGAVDFFGLPATFVSAVRTPGGSTVLTCDSGEGPTTILENLAFINGYNPGSGGGGVICSGSSPSFVNCLIADNFGANAGGAYCEYDSEARFYKCVFSGNVGGFYSAAPGALASVSGSNVSLKDCLLCDNAGADPQAPTNILGQWTDLGGNELLTDCPIPPCVADINRDGTVNGVDFAYIREGWGSDAPLADLNGDGQVDSADLGLAQDRRDHPVDVLALIGDGEEVAVVTLGGAEGEVHVEGGSLPGGRGELDLGRAAQRAERLAYRRSERRKPRVLRRLPRRRAEHGRRGRGRRRHESLLCARGDQRLPGRLHPHGQRALSEGAAHLGSARAGGWRVQRSPGSRPSASPSARRAGRALAPRRRSASRGRGRGGAVELHRRRRPARRR